MVGSAVRASVTNARLVVLDTKRKRLELRPRCQRVGKYKEGRARALLLATLPMEAQWKPDGSPMETQWKPNGNQ